MNIYEAFRIILNNPNLKATRKKHGNKYSFTANGKFLEDDRFSDGSGFLVTLHIDHILADDWEVVK